MQVTVKINLLCTPLLTGEFAKCTWLSRRDFPVAIYNVIDEREKKMTLQTFLLVSGARKFTQRRRFLFIFRF